MHQTESEYIVHRRLRLLVLFMLSTFGFLACLFSLFIGIPVLPTFFLSVALIFGWGFFFALAPDATKFITVMGFILLCLFSLAATSLLRSREKSRQIRIMDELRNHGKEYMQERDAYPTVVPPNSGYPPASDEF